MLTKGKKYLHTSTDQVVLVIAEHPKSKRNLHHTFEVEYVVSPLCVGKRIHWEYEWVKRMISFGRVVPFVED